MKWATAISIAERGPSAIVRPVAGDRLGQGGAPRSGVGRVAEVLDLVRDGAVGEFHDAHRERGHTVVGDDALADPQVPGADDAADREMPICRMTAALCPDGVAPAKALSGLRVVQDRVDRVDGVLPVAVPAFGGLPVLCQLGPVRRSPSIATPLKVRMP